MTVADDTDYLDYYPLSGGEIPVSSTKITKFIHLEGDKGRIFQFGGPDTSEHIHNKKVCRREGPISKYYQKRLPDEQTKSLAKGILSILRQQNSNNFRFPSESKLLNLYTGEELVFDPDMNLLSSSRLEYVDALDALISQVPEDVAVITQDPDTKLDHVTVAHLMSAAEWSSEWAIDKSFAQIHENAKKANGNLVIPNPSGIVQGMIRLSEPMQRIGAISWRSYRTLNYPMTEQNHWDWSDPNQKVLLRLERQTITAWPELNSFILTIRGYHDDLRSPKRLPAAIAALEAPKPDINRKAFIAEHGLSMFRYLKTLVAPVV